ncbi:MAG: polymer-forming cytoskeletal protein [Nitrospirae bacterium]|nr:polymer-forming cytoskeletal protein [Candidatus Manganitrophaceae bacterium]
MRVEGEEEIQQRGAGVMLPLMMIMILVMGLLQATAAMAEPASRDDASKRIITLDRDQVINEDYFAWGDVVEILGTVHGDLYAAGREIRVAGTVDGDLLAAGGKIDLAGRVGQDARLMGGEVRVRGEVGKNLTLAGGQIDLTEAAVVHGNVTSAAGNVTVSGKIDRNLKAMAGDVRLTPTAVVVGDMTYRSRDPAKIEPGAKIEGMVMQRTPSPMSDFSPGRIVGMMAGLFFFFKIISLVSTLIMGLLLIFLLPGFSRAVVSTLKEHPMASLGWGLIWLIVTPVVLLTLLVTVVGIPLALILFPLYLISLYLARIVILLWAGTALLERMGKRGDPGWGLLIGLFVYAFVTLIPGPGGLITFFVILFGLGAVLLTLRAKYSTA